MNVEVEVLIILVLAVLFILPFLVLMYVIIASKRAKMLAEQKAKEMSVEEVERIFKSPHSSRSKLNDALNYMIEHHVVIPGGEFNRYENLIKSLCKHRNTDKTLVLKFDRALNKANQGHKKSLAKVLKSALNARD
jgi:ABC-type multidrug transport system fused ATPase/permease subunit